MSNGIFTIHHDLEDKRIRAIPLCWKISHVAGFLTASIIGNVEMEVNGILDWNIIVEHSTWGTNFDCDMPMLVSLLSFVYGSMFCVFFLLCGLERAGLAPPKKIVVPGLIVCFIFTSISIYSSKHVTKGLQVFCQNIAKKIKTNISNISLKNTKGNVCGIHGVSLKVDGKSIEDDYALLDAATHVMLLQCLVWTFNGIILLTRCLLVTDFVLINTIVAKYNIPNYQQPPSNSLERGGTSESKISQGSVASVMVSLRSPSPSEVSLNNSRRNSIKILAIKDQNASVLFKEKIRLYKFEQATKSAGEYQKAVRRSKELQPGSAKIGESSLTLISKNVEGGKKEHDDNDEKQKDDKVEDDISKKDEKVTKENFEKDNKKRDIEEDGIAYVPSGSALSTVSNNTAIEDNVSVITGSLAESVASIDTAKKSVTFKFMNAVSSSVDQESTQTMIHQEKNSKKDESVNNDDESVNYNVDEIVENSLLTEPADTISSSSMNRNNITNDKTDETKKM